MIEDAPGFEKSQAKTGGTLEPNEAYYAFTPRLQKLLNPLDLPLSDGVPD